jgi:hypothetical protein
MGARFRRTLDAARGRPWGNSGRFTVELEAVTDQAPSLSAVGEIFFNHNGRMAHKWVHYLEAYSEQFERLRSGVRDVDGAVRPLRFLEIGVSHGGSLEMWRSYFGQDAVIFGVDLNPACAAFDGEAGQVRIGSQADRSFLASVVSEMGGVDVVLDDGSHIASHQRASIEVLYPLLSPGGLYVVEDVHSAYWRNFEGGYRRRGTFIEFVKDLIDDVHVPYHGRPARQPALSDAVASITIMDSLVFIQKDARRPPLNVRAGTPSW